MKKSLIIKYKYYGRNGSDVRSFNSNDVSIENTKLGKAYIFVDEHNTLMATVYLTDGTLSIRGEINQKEALKIINEMQMP